MSVISIMQLPKPGEPYADFQAAADLLNSVPLTADQVERGYSVFAAAQDGEGSGLAALAAFAEQEGLTPPDLAAQAIRVRALQTMDALSDGVDLKTECPDVYEAIMMGPIYPGDLGYFPGPEDAF
jgi:hypothetical protein